MVLRARNRSFLVGLVGHESLLTQALRENSPTGPSKPYGFGEKVQTPPYDSGPTPTYEGPGASG